MAELSTSGALKKIYYFISKQICNSLRLSALDWAGFVGEWAYYLHERIS